MAVVPHVPVTRRLPAPAGIQFPCPRLLASRFRGAEACFCQAVAVARRQHARMYELRAAVSLSRLWHQQGKGTAARHMLSAIYDWFTEGFDTADLQEARALLQA